MYVDINLYSLDMIRGRKIIEKIFLISGFMWVNEVIIIIRINR